MRCFEGLTHLVSSELEFGESGSSVHSVKRGGPKFQAVDNTCKGPVVGSVRGVFEGLGGRGWAGLARRLGQERDHFPLVTFPSPAGGAQIAKPAAKKPLIGGLN